MSDYFAETRKRNQTLLIVEGKHERNRLFRLIFQCFPEIDIGMDNVWIYGTNIYLLYEDIVKEYGFGWAEECIDIDLPFVISKKLRLEKRRYKDDFTNIILVFDYERHDTNFSKRKISDMQKIFSDMTDMGQLYINYPMIESYQHLKEIPDFDYLQRKISVSVRPGSKYKRLVADDTVIGFAIDFPYRMNDLLNKHYKIADEAILNQCCNEILAISTSDDIISTLRMILKDIVKNNLTETMVFHLASWISRVGYAYDGRTYWDHMQRLFSQIIYHNIWKAIYIQNGQDKIERDRYKSCFELLDMLEILKIQNDESEDDDNGYIWVLNTSVFLVAEYNFSWVLDDICVF